MFNPFSLKNKIVLITGASSGIGKQCAISCSKMGARIILVARNEDRLKSVMAELEGDNHLYFSIDITEYDKIADIVKKAVEKVGKIDGFIHSAGIEITKPLKVMKSYDYERLFSINVIAGFEFAKIITKRKNSNEGASLVFIASIMGVVANSALVGYCSSKGALISGIRALALEYASKKIRYNCVSPGYIETAMMVNVGKNLEENELVNIKREFPLGLGKPEGVANACVYLLSEASNWVTGTNLIIDGGYSAR